MVDATFDVIVIGAGPAGENAAAVTSDHGLATAIVESELVGGECSYWACIPSKVLLRPGEVVASARRTPGAAEAVTGEIDVAAALARRDLMVADWDDHGQVEWLDQAGVTLLRGHGRLDGPRRVTISTHDGDSASYEATRGVVLATGSVPVIPSIPGLDEVEVWDSRGLTGAKAPPASLAIIGGGPVGVEMAQAWAWLGTDVTLLERGDHVLSREEPFVGPEVQAGLERAGVTVVTNMHVRRITSGGSGAVMELATPDGARLLEVERLAVATGRRPHLDVGLETVGVEPDGFLAVNNHLQVEGVDGGWLYAVGDVNGRALLTHVGKYQARVAGAHLAGRLTALAEADVLATPRVIFTSPEVGAVGLTEEGAREAGYDITTVSHGVGQVSGAHTLGRGYRGTAKLVIDRPRRVLIGATFVGPHTGELIHSATVAIVGQVPLERLWHAIPSFPTVSEVWLRLLEAYRDGPERWDPYGTPV